MERKVGFAATDEGFNLLRKYLEKCQELWDEYGMKNDHGDGHVNFAKESPKLVDAIKKLEDELNYAPDKKALDDLIFRCVKNWEKVFKRRAANKQEEREKDKSLTKDSFSKVIKNYALDVNN